MRGTKTALSLSAELKGWVAAWCLSLLCMSGAQWMKGVGEEEEGGGGEHHGRRGRAWHFPVA